MLPPGGRRRARKRACCVTRNIAHFGPDSPLIRVIASAWRCHTSRDMQNTGSPPATVRTYYTWVGSVDLQSFSPTPPPTEPIARFPGISETNPRTDRLNRRQQWRHC